MCAKLEFANEFTTLVMKLERKKRKPIQCPRGMPPPKGRGCPHHTIPKAPHRPHKRAPELPCPTRLPFLPISRCSRAQQSQFPMAKWSLGPSWFKAMRQFTLRNGTRQRWIINPPKVYGSPLHVSTISFARFPHGRRVNEGREMLVADNIILAPKHTCMAIGRSPDTHHDNPFVSSPTSCPCHTELELLALSLSHSCKIGGPRLKRIRGLTKLCRKVGSFLMVWFQVQIWTRTRKIFKTCGYDFNFKIEFEKRI